MAFARVPLLLSLLHIAVAKQPSAPSAIAAPLRDLPWGQLNFLHTTDTHGWHAGHLQEAQYSGDWGDYISFSQHLRDRADSDGSDLLLIDTGDRVEGNGLYDASEPKGKYTLQIFPQQAIDVVTIGNHELYLQNSSVREYEQMVPSFKNSYIASNLNIYHPKTGELVPLASRFRKFTTKNQGVRILSFGFLFNFKGNANNTVVQPVEETVKEQWFQDAIRSTDVDLVVVAGHVPVRDSPEFQALYKAIRSVNWDVPLVFFGGHTHIRDYSKYESAAYALESGRYMETIGFLSISGIKPGKRDIVNAEASPTYKRIYIDNNLHSLHHHSGKNESNFNTELGLNVSKAITAARKEMRLDHAFGCAPKDLWLNRAPYPSNDSFLSLLELNVVPDTFKEWKKPAIVITNTGAIRFDVFKGPFTSDTRFLVSPFTSGFRILKDVPYKAASKVLSLLNNEGPLLLDDLAAVVSEQNGQGEPKLEPLRPARPPVNARSLYRSRVETSFVQGLPFEGEQQIMTELHGEKEEEPQVPGYTTIDDEGKDGDDTIHKSIKFYDVPNCIASNIGFSPSGSAGTVSDVPDKVDIIYNSFIQDWVILALLYLGEKRNVADTTLWSDGKTLTAVISDWVSENWKC